MNNQSSNPSSPGEITPVTLTNRGLALPSHWECNCGFLLRYSNLRCGRCGCTRPALPTSPEPVTPEPCAADPWREVSRALDRIQYEVYWEFSMLDEQFVGLAKLHIDQAIEHERECLDLAAQAKQVSGAGHITTEGEE